MSSFKELHGQYVNGHSEMGKMPDQVMEGGKAAGIVSQNIQYGSARGLLMRIEHDVACYIEKHSNLEILLVNVASLAGKLEALGVESRDLLANSTEMAFEFDILSGILESEIQELDVLVNSVQDEIFESRSSMSDSEFTDFNIMYDESAREMKQLQEGLSRMRIFVENLQSKLSLGAEVTSDNIGSDILENVGTPQNQRDMLRIWRSTFARDYELEKELSSLRQNEEDLKLRLRYTQAELLFMESMVEELTRRSFEADIIVQLISSKLLEVTGERQVMLLQLNGSIQRETDLQRSLQGTREKLSEQEQALEEKLVKCTELQDLLDKSNMKLKETEDKCALANSKVTNLDQELQSLQEVVRTSDAKLQSKDMELFSFQTHLQGVERTVSNSSEKVLEADTEATDAYLKVTELGSTDLDDSEDIQYSRLKTDDLEQSPEVELLDVAIPSEKESASHEMESLVDDLKAKLLEAETRSRESEQKLQIFLVHNDENVEQQSLLSTSLDVMECLVADLKMKAYEAETRAKESEEKCMQISDNKQELVEEVEYLRDRLERMEGCFNQIVEEKVAAAKDLCNRSKLITDMISELTAERSLLENQISLLVKENENLRSKYWISRNGGPPFMEDEYSESGKEFVTSKTIKGTGLEYTSVAGKEILKQSKEGPSYEEDQVSLSSNVTTGPLNEISQISVENKQVDSISTSEAVPVIGTGKFPMNYLVGFVVVAVSALIMYLIQQDSCLL